jgi:hypothetical protein
VPESLGLFIPRAPEHREYCGHLRQQIRPATKEIGQIKAIPQ